MKKEILFIAIAWIYACNFTFCQSTKEYRDLVKEAYKLYESKEYLNSGQKYSEAFKADGATAYVYDRYNAACSWALASRPDSAFDQLYIIANKDKFANYKHLIADSDLASLYGDERWTEIKEIAKTNKEKAEANFDKRLMAILDTIFKEDQRLRNKIVEVGEKYGWGS